LPEAAEIPIARLGLLAGLEDRKVIKPLTNTIQTLWKLAFLEELKEDTIRLHPLVRNFAEGLTPTNERTIFRTICAQRIADAYVPEDSGARRLVSEYAARGIAALLLDVTTAVELAQSTTHPTTRSPLPALQFLLRLLQREANHL
jgi:hypothetical protein